MAKQDDYIKTALRMPKALHARLTAQAEAKGRSLNAEFIASLDGGIGSDLPLELKARLELEAEKTGRSFIAELVARLEASLDPSDANELAFTVAGLSAALAEAEVELHTLRLNAGSLATCLRLASKMLNSTERDEINVRQMTELWLKLADRFDINPSALKAEGDVKIRALNEAYDKVTRLFDESGPGKATPSSATELAPPASSRRMNFRKIT